MEILNLSQDGNQNYANAETMNMEQDDDSDMEIGDGRSSGESELSTVQKGLRWICWFCITFVSMVVSFFTFWWDLICTVFRHCFRVLERCLYLVTVITTIFWILEQV